jgi:hypothetical protein
MQDPFFEQNFLINVLPIPIALKCLALAEDSGLICVRSRLLEGQYRVIGSPDHRGHRVIGTSGHGVIG